MASRKSLASHTRLGIVPGFERLGSVLDDALEQAQSGKGKERHGGNEVPFHDQLITRISNHVGEGFNLGQAIKKIIESRRLTAPRAKHELLGAIVYISGQIVRLEERFS